VFTTGAVSRGWRRPEQRRLDNWTPKSGPPSVKSTSGVRVVWTMKRAVRLEDALPPLESSAPVAAKWNSVQCLCGPPGCSPIHQWLVLRLDVRSPRPIGFSSQIAPGERLIVGVIAYFPPTVLPRVKQHAEPMLKVGSSTSTANPKANAVQLHWISSSPPGRTVMDSTHHVHRTGRFESWRSFLAHAFPGQ
jgi:hypothetical protein